MESVLLASATEKGRQLLLEMINMFAYERIAYASNGGEARRKLLEDDYDMIVVNAPLGDEFGERFSLMAAEHTDAGILILVPAQAVETVEETVGDAGVLVISKPVSRQIFYQAMKLAVATKRRMRCLRREYGLLQKKIEDIRQVDRAKCTLIQVFKMSEPQAHRYIEKQAMDLRLSRREVAEQILKTYEQ